ncbi:hypothetical protein LIER_15554 [Lithospermum erythrorhizon]|uniref:Uncharacterized protein n=1 Tax=Lithospermum erythrorhizon TaxID=34254 RepID=A0AAV3Q5V6_LITER
MVLGTNELILSDYVPKVLLDHMVRSYTLIHDKPLWSRHFVYVKCIACIRLNACLKLCEVSMIIILTRFHGMAGW